MKNSAAIVGFFRIRFGDSYLFGHNGYEDTDPAVDPTRNGKTMIVYNKPFIFWLSFFSKKREFAFFDFLKAK
jgi:hypothetical protein